MDLLKDFQVDPNKTPSELTGYEVSEMPSETTLMTKVRRYANTPLAIIDDEGLRVLLGQGRYLNVIVPAAICYLHYKPFAGGNLEDGALMRTLFLLVDTKFWTEHPDLFAHASQVFAQATLELSPRLTTECDPENRSLLEDAEGNFQQINKKLVELSLTRK